jgi:hypothetical protein
MSALFGCISKFDFGDSVSVQDWPFEDSQRVFGGVDRTSSAEQGTRPVPERSSETIRKLSRGRRPFQLGASCIVNLPALWSTNLVISWHSEF